ncbi:MAG: hypothetical protein GYA45_11340 [Pelolinea sp.]|nr:hypothetical protein [Pelolinea sp.]
MKAKRIEHSTEQTKKAEQEPHRQSGKYQAGAICPYCNQGILEYNGLLNIQCSNCGLEIRYSST